MLAVSYHCRRCLEVLDYVSHKSLNLLHNHIAMWLVVVSS